MHERGLWVAIGERPWIGLVVAVAIVLLDQWTKQVAVSALSFREPVEVTSWFDWLLTYNTGAAFSFLAEAGGWQRWFLAGELRGSVQPPYRGPHSWLASLVPLGSRRSSLRLTAKLN